MSSKILLRIASVIMFLRLIGQFLDYPISKELNKAQNYLWQRSDLANNHEFFYWGFSIVFALEGRLLWFLGEANDKTLPFANRLIEPAFFFLFAFGIEEFVYKYYYTGATTAIAMILVGIAYFKMKGISINITYKHQEQ